MEELHQHGHHLVTKSNTLIEARHCLSVIEQRIIALVASKISPDDEDFHPSRFQVSELMQLVSDQKAGASYDRVEKAAKGLLKRPFALKTETSTVWMNWVSSVEYYESDGIVEIAFDPKLKPFLLQLKGRFTSHSLASVIRLQSRYSVRLYELLKQYESIGKRSFELPELREYLALEKHEYKRWQDFRRWVLAPALKELPAKTDIAFSYTTRKKGRKVWYIDCDIQVVQRKSELSEKQIRGKRAAAAKCLAQNPGCTARWEHHTQPVEAAACHFCKRFDRQRAEAAGQLRLID